MIGLAPCPSCGIPVRLETMVRWTRLVALGRTPCPRFRMPSPPDFSTQLEMVCPACRCAITFPLDAPLIAA